MLRAAVFVLLLVETTSRCYQEHHYTAGESDNGLVCGGQDSGCDLMGIGDGDCDRDSDCHTGLKCGSNNCGKFRPSHGWPDHDYYGWDRDDDCCDKPHEPTGLESDNALVCGGVDDGCAKMGISDGDCDRDSDCHTGLACGTNNCGKFRPSYGWPSSDVNAWDMGDDCCYQPHLSTAGESDNGIVCGGRDSGCDKMGIGDGDCDHDHDCHAGLKCGSSNCDEFRSSYGWHHHSHRSWDRNDDCCYLPGSYSFAMQFSQFGSVLMQGNSITPLLIAAVMSGCAACAFAMRWRRSKSSPWHARLLA